MESHAIQMRDRERLNRMEKIVVKPSMLPLQWENAGRDRAIHGKEMKGSIVESMTALFILTMNNEIRTEA